ncbi:MAG: hypothetical protein NZ602_04950, partial [Thermoguttaceae bacterium]|nr:hypothetical protein [Thermoguttaceae bacterium]
EEKRSRLSPPWERPAEPKATPGEGESTLLPYKTRLYVLACSCQNSLTSHLLLPSAFGPLLSKEGPLTRSAAQSTLSRGGQGNPPHPDNLTVVHPLPRRGEGVRGG